jgi:hypothetical protein
MGRVGDDWRHRICGNRSHDRVLFLIAFHSEFFIFTQLTFNETQSIRAANFIEKGQHGRNECQPIYDQKTFTADATPRQARLGAAHHDTIGI